MDTVGAQEATASPADALDVNPVSFSPQEGSTRLDRAGLFALPGQVEHNQLPRMTRGKLLAITAFGVICWLPILVLVYLL
jgi:hypothetical protein